MDWMGLANSALEVPALAACLAFLKIPFVVQATGFLAFISLIAAFLVKKPIHKFALALLTALVTMAYSYATGGYWMVGKWAVMMAISIYQLQKYWRSGDDKALDQVCDECLKRQ